MRASDLTSDARRPGLAWAIGVLDAAGRFRVTTRRRVLAADLPTDLNVEVSCYEDVGAILMQVFGGEWVIGRDASWRGRWRLRAHEIAEVLETVIPLMRNAKAVRAAQTVLSCHMLKGKPGPQVSAAVRQARREAAAAGGML